MKVSYTEIKRKPLKTRTSPLKERATIVKSCDVVLTKSPRNSLTEEPIMLDRKPSTGLPLKLSEYKDHEMSSICAAGSPPSGPRRSIWSHIGNMKKSPLYPQCCYSDPY